MMKWGITLILAGTMAGGAIAQDVKTRTAEPEQEAIHLVRQMTDDLSLTSEQAKQIHKVVGEQLRQAANERAATGDTQQPQDRKLREQQLMEAVKQVLTAEQYQKWVALREYRMSRTPDGQPIQAVTPVE